MEEKLNMAVTSSSFTPWVSFMALDKREEIERIVYSSFEKALGEYKTMNPRYRIFVQDTVLVVPQETFKKVTLWEKFEDFPGLKYGGYVVFDGMDESPRKIVELDHLGEVLMRYPGVVGRDVSFAREVLETSLRRKK